MQRLQEYVKYTKAELDSYSETKGSCVYKINQNLHFAINAYILNDMNKALPAYILKNRVGYYDASLNGIILAVKNIKVLNGAAALRFDDPKLHIEINADCYVFRPEEGAILTGIPKHIGKHHVGIIIYGVFNASVRLEEQVNKSEVKLNQELKFQIKNFNIRIAHPYIQGTLLNMKQEKDTTKIVKIEGKRTTFKSDDEDSSDNSSDSTIQEAFSNVKREKNNTKIVKTEAKIITFKSDDEDSNDDNNDVSNQTPDSGIEEKQNNDLDAELKELLSSIKDEPLSEPDQEMQIKMKNKSIKRRRTSTESSDKEIPAAKIKSLANKVRQKKRKSTELSDSSDSKTDNKTEKKKIKTERRD